MAIRKSKMGNDPNFLDASGWIALVNRTEDHHAEANRIWRDLGKRRVLTFVTDWIVAETGNGLARSRCRDLFSRSVRIFMTSANVRLIHIDGSLLNKALDLYDARQDKGWGLVDCASFVLMTEEGIRDALTSDHHFEQAGFRRLLR
jgi:predicted nucleic acid-binding protein